MVGQVNFFYCIEKTKFLQLKFTSAKKKNTYSYIGPNVSDKHKRKKKKKGKKRRLKGG